MLVGELEYKLVHFFNACVKVFYSRFSFLVAPIFFDHTTVQTCTLRIVGRLGARSFPSPGVLYNGRRHSPSQVDIVVGIHVSCTSAKLG